MYQLHPTTPKASRKTDIQGETSLDACRRYLAEVAKFCAAAAGDPNPNEVRAAMGTLR